MKPRDRWGPLLLVVVVSLVMPCVQLVAFLYPWIPSHDDTLSLVLSAGNLRDAQAGLDWDTTHRLRPADVTRYLDPPARLRPGAILADIYERDIHPPLYFLLLHVWRWLLGGGVGTAILLSAVVCCLSACGLFLAVRRFAGPGAAVLFGMLYCLCPPYREAALTARQYGLSACFAIGLAALVVSRQGGARESGGRTAMLFVLTASLIGLTAHQTIPLVLSLLAGWIVWVGLRARDTDGAPLTAAVLGVALAHVPLVLLAQRQGRHVGALGASGWLFTAPGDPAEALRGGVQVFVSLFVDVPFTWVPLPVLLPGAVIFLLFLGWKLAVPRGSQESILVFLAATATGLAVYAGLVLLGWFPARFHLYYFAAYSAAYLVLLARAVPDDPRGRKRALKMVAVLCVLSAAVFAARMVRQATGIRPAEHAALTDLRRSAIVLTDARRMGHILRLAAMIPPDADLWLVRLPIEESACREIGATARAGGAALARLGEEDPAALEAALETCFSGTPPARRARARWLDLVLWPPRLEAAPSGPAAGTSGLRRGAGSSSSRRRSG